MSPDGACVAPVNSAPMPDAFRLQLDANSEIGEAKVMWRAENAVGVKLMKAKKP